MAETASERVRADFHLVPPEETGETPIIYANYLQATFSPVDATLHLGWYATPTAVETPGESVPVHVRGLANVTLPIGIIPGLIDLLQRQLAAWHDSVQELRAGEQQEQPS